MVAGGPRLQRPFLPLEQRVEKMTQQQTEEQEVQFKYSQTQRGRKHVSTSVNSVSDDGKTIPSLVSKHQKIKAVEEENKANKEITK